MEPVKAAPLDPELAALLLQGQGNYEQGLDDINPAPPDGQYNVLLTNVSARGVETGGKDGKPKEKATIVSLGLKIIGHPALDGYGFKHSCWSTNATSIAQIGTFATCSAGKPVKLLTEAFAILKAEENAAAYQVTISRTTAKQTGREYVNVHATQKLELSPPKEETAKAA